MLVSIIILNFNGINHLKTCLDSMQNQSFRNFEVILVDNGSTDGSVDFLKDNYPWVKLIELPSNTGFATGNNIGLRHSTGRYIVTLNNDTSVDAAWLVELIRAAESDDAVGMVASRICVYDHPDIIDSLGVRITPDGMSRGSFRLERYEDVSPKKYESVLMPSACAALYKKEMIEEVGFFDDDFFAYCEDTDLGFRCRLHGWNAILASDAIVYHKYSQTGGALSPFKVYHVERNHFWVCIKNMPASLLWRLPFYTLVRYFYQVWVLLVPGGLSHEYSRSSSKAALISAFTRGVFHATTGIPKMLKKRKDIMTTRRIDPGSMIDLLNSFKLTYRELFDRAG